jgi:hypothetical protein
VTNKGARSLQLRTAIEGMVVMISWQHFKLMQRCRALRAQGLQVSIRGWLLVIEGGKQRGASFQRRPRLSARVTVSQL